MSKLFVFVKYHVIILAIIGLIGLVCFLLWSPGFDVRDGRHDLKMNGIWIQHGWLGDDNWFQRNNKDKSQFRDGSKLQALAAEMKAHHIRDLYPHLCPCSSKGDISPSDPKQVELLLDKLSEFRVFPWVGGVCGADAIVDDPNWRRIFAKSCSELLMKHPRLAGVHVNIEPMRSGNKNYLKLLDEIRTSLPKGKLLSVAAYPPPTRWQPSTEVHWDEEYSREVASRVDQVCIMMYDTSLKSPKLYQALMNDWTQNELGWFAQTEVLLGIPAYNDAGVGYHDPNTENISNSLLGIHAGLPATLPKNYRGVCIYCEWEMTPQKWKDFDDMFCAR